MTGLKFTVDGAAGGVYFETDQAITDTPTLYLTLATTTGDPVSKFILEDVQYMMNPTAAETYQLWLLEGNSAEDTAQQLEVVFYSPAAQVDSTAYRYSNLGVQVGVGAAEGIQYKLPRLVELTTPNTLYYMLDWSGAPGVTPGYIKVRGRALK